MGLMLPVLTDDRAGQPSRERPPAAPSHVRQGRVMRDSHGRIIRELRLSITDRCNFRCVYCMEPDVEFAPADERLTVEELVRMARVCAGLGVSKVRLTGGEPTLHPDLERIIAGVAAAGISDLAMTTNGSLLDAPRLAAWKRAGLNRLTISIDSVDPVRFQSITRSRTHPGQVIDGIRRAQDAGLGPIRLNAVIIRDVNDDEIVPLARLAREQGVEMRFIEFMPLDSAHDWKMDRVVTAEEIVSRIEAVFPLVAELDEDPSSTASRWHFADGASGGIGVIAPVSRPFCGACSRLRITADGMVRPCLFSAREWDLRSLLRDGGTDQQLAEFLIDATWTKQAGHGIGGDHFEQPHRSMSAIGG